MAFWREGAHTRWNFGSVPKPKRFTPYQTHDQNGRIRRHPRSVVESCIRLANEHGIKHASQMTGVKVTTVKSWVRLRFLPKTGPMRFENVMLLVRHAARINRQKFIDDPVRSLWQAAKERGLNWNTVKLYLYMEAFPTIPGFKLYANLIVNKAAEEYGSGVRNYGHALGLPHKNIPPYRFRNKGDPSRNGKSSVPPQKHRKFLIELREDSPMPRR